MKKLKCASIYVVVLAFFLQIALSAYAATPVTPAPGVSATPAASDIAGHWAEATLKKWISGGMFKGDASGLYRPNDGITRAEFIALVNRMKKLTKAGEKIVKFSDVQKDSWYYGDMSIALEAGYISGTSATTVSPDRKISRQEAIVILARISGLTESKSTAILSGISDSAELDGWARGPVAEAVSAGLVTGSNGKLTPKRDISRAETVVLLDRVNSGVRQFAFPGTYGPDSGTLELSSAEVLVSGVTLQNMKIKGSLTVTSGVVDGVVKLKNVAVADTLTVAGGGAHCVDGSLNNISVTKDGAHLTLSGSYSLQNLTINGKNVAVTLGGSIQVQTLTTNGSTTELTLEDSVHVVFLMASGVVSVTGGNRIGTAFLTMSGSSFDFKPSWIISQDDNGVYYYFLGGIRQEGTMEEEGELQGPTENKVVYKLSGFPQAIDAKPGWTSAQVVAWLISEIRPKLVSDKPSSLSLAANTSTWKLEGDATNYDSTAGRSARFIFTCPSPLPSDIDASRSVLKAAVTVNFRAAELKTLTLAVDKRRTKVEPGGHPVVRLTVTGEDQYRTAIACEAAVSLTDKQGEAKAYPYLSVQEGTLVIDADAALAAFGAGDGETVYVRVAQGTVVSNLVSVYVSSSDPLPHEISFADFEVERPLYGGGPRAYTMEALVLDQDQIPLEIQPPVTYALVEPSEHFGLGTENNILVVQEGVANLATVRVTATCAAIAQTDHQSDTATGTMVSQSRLPVRAVIASYPQTMQVPVSGSVTISPGPLAVDAWDQYNEKMSPAPAFMFLFETTDLYAHMTVDGVSGMLSLFSKYWAAADGATVTMTARTDSSDPVTGAPVVITTPAVTITLKRDTSVANSVVLFDETTPMFLYEGQSVTLSAHVCDQYGVRNEDYTPSISLVYSYPGVTLVGNVLSVAQGAQGGSVKIIATYGSVRSIEYEIRIEVGNIVKPIDPDTIRFEQRGGENPGLYLSWNPPDDPQREAFSVMVANYDLMGHGGGEAIAFSVGTSEARDGFCVSSLMAADRDSLVPGMYHLIVVGYSDNPNYQPSAVILRNCLYVGATRTAPVLLESITHPPENTSAPFTYTLTLESGSVFQADKMYALAGMDGDANPVALRTFNGNGAGTYVFTTASAIPSNTKLAVYEFVSSAAADGKSGVLSSLSQKYLDVCVTAAAPVPEQEEESQPVSEPVTVPTADLPPEDQLSE